MSRRYLVTRDIADLIGVEPAFIRGEVTEGRLKAAVLLRRPGYRTIYRFLPEDVVSWLEQHSAATLELPHVRERLTSSAA